MKTRIFVLSIALFSVSFLQAQWTTAGNVTHTNNYIGIGTASPSSPIHFERNENGSTILQITNSDPGASARAGLSIGTGTSGSHFHMFRTSTGYTGVSTWQNAGILSTDSGVLNGMVLRTSTGNIRFQPGGTTDKIVFTENGNVGIGILNIPAGYKLAVDGKIIAEELKVQLSGDWPDYVFQSDYQLASLEEVEAHIQTNGHLPNIPSATEVEENGIAVGDMQRRMMEKIEELTLHLIEQNKQIKSLQEELSSLKKQ